MTIFGLMVTRNEAGRYLELALDAARPAVDELFVFDDCSTDTTVEVAHHHGCTVEVRTDATPPFLDHEGRFRQGAWDTFCRRLRPQEGDWVLAVDADEIVVANDPDVLRDAARSAQNLARLIRIPEVFDVRDGWPYVRVDGWWGRIQGSRFFAWQPLGQFADRAMASGSEPSYIQGAIGPVVDGFWLVHLGYARDEDRRAKYERYSTRTGHADAHVASILQPADLHRWDGPSMPGVDVLFVDAKRGGPNAPLSG